LPELEALVAAPPALVPRAVGKPAMDAVSPPPELPDNLETMSDRALVTAVVGTLGSPPAAEADSFVLHAPLELMARAELLPSVVPAERGTARQRIVEIARDWADHAPLLPPPTEPPSLSLAAAVAAGDLDEADRAIVDLATHRTVDQFVAGAADALLTHLGGAAHLAIFLDQLTRVSRSGASAMVAARALVRDLARHPGWTIGWIDDPSPGAGGSVRTLTEVVANPQSAGDPGSTFIYPTMHLVDSTGMAAELLRGPTRALPVEEARWQLLRIAAMSMLRDDPASAPYGWSHCLTMAQAALAVAPRTADPQRAVAVAATYVLGFRATLSNTTIDLDWQPPKRSADEAFGDAHPDDVVARAWHTARADRWECELATYAATHHDAHLAKYVLACLHAAHDDPGAAPLYRAAAARLAVWWRDADAAR
jgi:hypothetical protein